MNRRNFLTSSFALGACGVISAQQCALIAPGVTGCRTEISIDEIVLAATLQHCPMWCWAASVVAVFKFFGHDLEQEDVVMSSYGQLVCVGAQKPIQIAQTLSRPWIDGDGNKFRLRITAAYDPQSGVSNINNAIIVNELRQGRPLIYCNTHHAMVISAADYRPTQLGPLIDGIGVVDPWPPAPRLHPLSGLEMRPLHLGGQMTFLASLAVADLS